jgi:hypothetical protein
MAGLTDQLQQHISRSALLMVLMSPDYLKSSWCKDEREWWCSRQVRSDLPNDGRIPIVHIWPRAKDDIWPSALSDSRGIPLIGFPFTEGKAPMERPIGWTDRPTFGKSFKERLLDLAGVVRQKLDKIKADLEELNRARADAASLAREGGQTIYLHGHEGQDWERAARALGDARFAVLPGQPDPDVSDREEFQALRERRAKVISGCDALLLLGTQDGHVDGDMLLVGKHDRDLAKALSNRYLPCALLDTVGPSIATPVRRTTAQALQIEWLDATTQPWVPVIPPWLVAAAKRARP